VSHEQLSGTNRRLRESNWIAEPRASSQPSATLATFFGGDMVVMGSSFIAQKEELDGYHACSPISWSQPY